MSNLLDTFDFWETILKARKPKGLDNWSRLQHLSERLAGKQISAISFTCAHPSHEGQPVKHNLGSVMGNIHWLLGYGNPAFYFAEYHWLIIDPSLSEEEAAELYKGKKHASIPTLWSKSGLEMEVEGDVEEGSPLPVASGVKKKKERESKGIKVSSGFGRYVASPDEGLIFGEHNGQAYSWDLVRDSYFAATNENVYNKMEEARRDQEEDAVEKSLIVPDLVRHRCSSIREFDEGVYDLVKSRFPVVGSIIPIDSNSSEIIYGVVTPSSIKFVDRQGLQVRVPAYGRDLEELDLLKGGDTHPSVLYNFAVNYLGFDSVALEDLAKSSYVGSDSPAVVIGAPTPGFDDDDIDFLNIEDRKHVEILEDNTYRLVIRD